MSPAKGAFPGLARTRRTMMGTVIGVFLCSYLFFIPWDGYLVGLGLPVVPTTFLFGLGLLLCVGLLSQHWPVVRLPVYLLPLIGLLIYATFSLAWAPALALTRIIDLWRYLAMLLLFLMLIPYANYSPLGLLSFYVIGVCSRGIFAWFALGMAGSRFVIAEGANPRDFSAMAAWAVVAAIPFFWTQRSVARIALVGATATLVLLITIAQQRNALQALAFSLPLALVMSCCSWDAVRGRLLLNRLATRRVTIASIALVVVATVVGAALIEGGMHGELGRLSSSLRLSSESYTPELLDRATAGRWTLWSNYSSLLLSYGPMGGGIGSARLLYENRYGKLWTPHNMYIRVLVEYGVIGLLLWGAFLLSMVRHSLKQRVRSFPFIWLALCFPFFAFGNDILYSRHWWVGLLVFVLLSSDAQLLTGSKQGLPNDP